MNIYLKIFATVVFAVFAVMCSVATYSLGFWYGPIICIVMIGALLYEIWIAPLSEEQHRHEILREIEGFREDIQSMTMPRNLQDARDEITELRAIAVSLGDAYCDLYDDFTQDNNVHGEQDEQGR